MFSTGVVEAKAGQIKVHLHSLAIEG